MICGKHLTTLPPARYSNPLVDYEYFRITFLSMIAVDFLLVRASAGGKKCNFIVCTKYAVVKECRAIVGI
jgi:hypothetical protein